MTKWILILMLPVLIHSCIGQYKSEAQKAQITEASPNRGAVRADTLQVDLAESNIHWKGTKMRGAGKHEGELKLLSAYLLHEIEVVRGGQFVADMTSIGVTDIPETDPIPIRNINNHLKSADFFDVAKYPTSKFVITSVDYVANDSIAVTGNLTLKDITKHISFGATIRDDVIATQFIFDRFQWDIAYAGNWADKTLVDRDVELTIYLKLNYKIL